MLVYEVLRDTSIPLYNLPEKATRALRVLRTYRRMAEKLRTGSS